jgi:phosphoserine aminotransferase
MMQRAHNFNAGPAALPLEVLQTAAEQMINFDQTGMSLMELSHRSANYERVHDEAQQRFRSLFRIPENYKILFLQGGASTQFAMVPMNLLSREQRAAYVISGSWGVKAYKEAQLFGDAFVLATSKDTGYRSVPELSKLSLDNHTAYVHVTSNETIEGVQFDQFPSVGHTPIIADMSSDILSRALDVSHFSLIYAGAQKNLGPSGVTVVIVREDWVQQSPAHLATMLRYDTHASNNSLYNTPPTFSIYMMNLVLKWVESQGGLKAIEQLNLKKTDLIYDTIDRSGGFYTGHAEAKYRSRMNITFRLHQEEAEKKFLKEAEQAGFIGLKGHRSVGGCRASTYNAVPYESCLALAQFMQHFQQTYA